MKTKSSDLTGPALDWAVAKCEGRSEPEVVNNFAVAWYTWGNTHYSTSWALAGPIIEREAVALIRQSSSEWLAFSNNSPAPWYLGPTPLIAAMRCYVASKLGEEVDVPEELV